VSAPARDPQTPPAAPASLAHARVLITRAPGDQAALAERLAARGAQPVAFPCIELGPPEDPAPLEAALELLLREPRAFLAAAFTSPHAVEQLSLRLRAHGSSPSAALAAMLVGGAGEGTARALAAEGIAAVVPASGAGAAPLAAALIERLRGEAPAAARADAKVFLPQAAESSPALADALRAAGYRPCAVALYQTRPIAGLGPEHQAGLAALRAREIDLIAFASGSAVRGFAHLLGPQSLAVASSALVVCMGESCAEVARAAGFSVAATGASGLDALLDAAAASYAARLAGEATC